MCWKNANFFRFKPLSLVMKLMFFYSLSTLSLLSAISLFLYPTFIKVIEYLNKNQANYLTVECYKKVILTLLIGSLSAIIFSYFVARKGLNSLREFENKMEKITTSSLHERIHINEWPKELSRFGEKFNIMLDRIQASFIQISQFSSDIAHELRTPINNLMGMTEIALSNKDYNEKQRQLLEKYMNEYYYLSKLIESLLFFSRSDNGQIHLNKVKINIRNEILNIFDYYQAIADENKIMLTCEGEASILADLTLFKRVIINLLSNALKYTTRNGKISVNIKTIDQFIEISIHDTGIGISEDHLKKIFDRFYRVDSSRSTHSGSLGLGLAIVKSIIELHAGNISIESKLNSGTSVYLKLPSPSYTF